MPKKILVLASNPLDTGRIRVEKEIKIIKDAIQQSDQRDNFPVESVPAVTYKDLVNEIRHHKPNVVHFAGHGIGQNVPETDADRRQFLYNGLAPEQGGLILEDDSGKMQLVDNAALTRLFKLFRNTVECVIFNACHSHKLAEAVAEYIPCSIGMGKAITDGKALEFSEAFYRALGDGENYASAFESACTTIDLSGSSESDTPKIFHQKSSYPPEDEHRPEPSPEIAFIEIINELFNGCQIIPFLGKGISSEIYVSFAQSLGQEIVKTYFSSNNLSLEDQESFNDQLQKEVLGFPCQVCPYINRPEECPIIQSMKGTGLRSLDDEQNLAIASMNLSYLCQYQYSRSSLPALYNKLRRIWDQPNFCKTSNTTYQLFNSLARTLSRNPNITKPIFPIIITTNYDNFLEKDFEDNSQPYDLIYYCIDDSEEGKFKYRRYNDEQASLLEPASISKLPPHPTIIKLYGTRDEFFAITQEQINVLISTGIDQLKSVDVIKNALNRSPLLFLGCSPSDSEVKLIVNKLWSKAGKFEKLPKNSTMIHRSKIGNIEENFWEKNRQVKLIYIEKSWEEFAEDFEQEITKRM